MRSFFRFVLLSLVLLVVALVSALTAMRFAIHGREVEVPNLVGKTPAEARRITEEQGFELTVEREYYSPTVPEGDVLSQLPPVGTLVRRGWEIRVAKSLGPQRVEIPNVLGQSERAAEMNIRRRGLDVNTVAVMPAATAAEQVLSQSPPPDASGVAAPKISLLVAEAAPARAFLMPSFVGQALGSARLIVQTAGLRVGMVTVATGAGATVPAAADASTPAVSSTAPVTPASPSAGSIIASQNPTAGERVVAGTVVNFEVK